MFWGKDGVESILDKYREVSCSCEICMTVLKDSTLKLVRTFCSKSESDAAGVHLIFDELAKDLWKEKFYEKAAIAFEIAHSVKPQDPKVLAHLASTAYKSGLLVKCQELCEDAVMLASENNSCLLSYVAKLNYKVFLDKETTPRRKITPLRKIWDQAHCEKHQNKKKALLPHDSTSSTPCSCGQGALGNTDDDELAMRLFLSSGDSGSSSDDSINSEEGCSPTMSRFADGLRSHYDSGGRRWLPNYNLPTSKLASSLAANILTKRYGGPLDGMKLKEQMLVKCEAIRSLHQKMYEDSVLRLSDHFHTSSATPDLRYSGVCFNRDKTKIDRIIEPNQDWSAQYHKVQRYLAEKATAEVFLPNYETKSTLSTIEIDDALQSFSFIPKRFKEHEFERREVDEWISNVGIDLFGESFFESRCIVFEKYFGPHLKVKATNGKKKRRTKKAPCSTQCVPCWAKRMWAERFGGSYSTEIDEANTGWANLGFFGSGKELEVSKESALVHSVVFVCVLQCHANWCGTPISKKSDAQWQLMEAIFENHELCNLRCGMLAMLETIFRAMKTKTLNGKLGDWKACNRASDVAMRPKGTVEPKKYQQKLQGPEVSDKDLTGSWFRWASCRQVEKEEEFAYRTLFREISLYALGCATEKLREEYTDIMCTLFEKDIMTCYCCGPRRILIRSMLGRSRALLETGKPHGDGGSYEKKLDILDQVIQHRKTSPKYVYDKATIHVAKGDLRNGEKDCRKALELLQIPDRDRLGSVQYPEVLQRKDLSFKSQVLKLLGDIHIKRSELATSLLRQIALRQEALKFYHFSRIECPHDTLQSDVIGKCIGQTETKLDLDKEKKALFAISDDAPVAPKNINPLVDPIPADIEPICVTSQAISGGVKDIKLDESNPELESGSTITQKVCDYENCKQENHIIKDSDPWVEGFCDQLCSFICHKNCWRAYSRETGGGFPCACVKTCNGQILAKVWFLNKKTEAKKRAEMESVRNVLGHKLAREPSGTSSIVGGNTVDDPSKMNVARAAPENCSSTTKEVHKYENISCGSCEKDMNQFQVHDRVPLHRRRRKENPRLGADVMKQPIGFVQGQGTTHSSRQMNSSDVLKGIVEVLKLSTGSMHLSNIKDGLKLEAFGLERGEAGKYADDVFSLREVVRMNPDVLSLEKAPYEVPMNPQVAYLGNIDMDANIRGRKARRSTGIKRRTAWKT